MFETESDTQFDVFTDLLFNALVGFAFMFFVALAMVNPVAETGMIDTNVEMLITMTWPDNDPDDIDLYMQDPAGNVVWYNTPEAGLMNLDRDDRGQFKDVIIVNGQEVANPLNQETISVRGLMDGEYVVNAVHYIANGIEPVPVTVKVEKMNPVVRVIYYGDLTLSGTGDEQTAVRFTLDGNEVSDVNTRSTSLVALTRGGGGAPLAGGILTTGADLP